MPEGEERTDSSLAALVTWGRWKLFASTESLLTGASHLGPGCCRFLVLISLCWCWLCSAWLGLVPDWYWLAGLGLAGPSLRRSYRPRAGYLVLVTGPLLGPCFVCTVSRVSGGSEGENTAVVVGCVDCVKNAAIAVINTHTGRRKAKPQSAGQHSTAQHTQRSH